MDEPSEPDQNDDEPDHSFALGSALWHKVHRWVDALGSALWQKFRRWVGTQQTRWRRRRFRNISNWIQFGVLIAASVYGAVTYQLWNTTREGIHSGQRAYLLVKNLSLIDPQLAIGSRMWFQWDIKNVGQTPARNPITHFVVVIDRHEPRWPPDGYSSEHSWNTYTGSNALGPGESEPAPSAPRIWLDGQDGRLWTDEDAARLKNGERLWVKIVVQYETAFEGVSGETSLCAYYEGSRFSLCGTDMK